LHQDYYTVEVARLINPRIARIADLTTRFRLHHANTGYANPLPFDALIAPSRFVAQQDVVVIEHIPTFVTHGAVDVDTWSPGAPPADWCVKSAWTKVAGDGPVFGFVARLSLEKGPGLFLAAAGIVLQRIPTARFLMVGRPTTHSYLTGLWRLAQAYGVADHVGFHSVCICVVSLQCHHVLAGFCFLVLQLPQLVVHKFVSPSDMPRVFACMDVFVAPFIRPATETFGLVNIEAAAMGVPFVHFGTGGIQVCNPFCSRPWLPSLLVVASHRTMPKIS
jgi:glycosyltransferase involved in cell wall biosynthesis